MNKFKGVVPGIVKSLKDEEGLGRIQVQLPRLAGENRTFWASVAAPMAGKERGCFFSPEEHDEVLVAFDEGDPQHPYVLGFLWNGVDKPPETELQNRVIVTPGGHMLRFEDKAGAQKIVIRSQGKHELILEDTSSTAEVRVKSAGGLQITLNDVEKSITLEGGGRVLTMKDGQVAIS